MYRKTLIATGSLCVGYPEKEIISDISLQIRPGELIAIIGANGSGKSTLLRTLTGELAKKSGKIQLNNKLLESFTPRDLARHISVVLTNSDYSKHLSVYEVISLGRHPYTNWLGLLNQKDKQIIKDVMKKMDIIHFAHRSCNELSDGQMQKVFLTRALVQDTEVVLLDEPTNHLDLYHRVFILKLLKDLVSSTQKAILFATHQISLALEICDKIILIKDGKLTLGTPQELIDQRKIHALFPQDSIHFDSTSKSFKLNLKDKLW